MPGRSEAKVTTCSGHWWLKWKGVLEDWGLHLWDLMLPPHRQGQNWVNCMVALENPHNGTGLRIIGVLVTPFLLSSHFHCFLPFYWKVFRYIRITGKDIKHLHTSHPDSFHVNNVYLLQLLNIFSNQRLELKVSSLFSLVSNLSPFAKDCPYCSGENSAF